MYLTCQNTRSLVMPTVHWVSFVLVTLTPMNDADAIFADLVYLCEKYRAGKNPTMHDVQRVAVALILKRRGWLKHHGYTNASAREFVGERYTGVIDRVRQAIDDHPFCELLGPQPTF